jgi:hypothetical protein
VHVWSTVAGRTSNVQERKKNSIHLWPFPLGNCFSDVLGDVHPAKISLYEDELKLYTGEVIKSSTPIDLLVYTRQGRKKNLKPCRITRPSVRGEVKRMDRPFIQFRRPGSRKFS